MPLHIIRDSVNYDIAEICDFLKKVLKNQEIQFHSADHSVSLPLNFSEFVFIGRVSRVYPRQRFEPKMRKSNQNQSNQQKSRFNKVLLLKDVFSLGSTLLRVRLLHKCAEEIERANVREGDLLALLNPPILQCAVAEESIFDVFKKEIVYGSKSSKPVMWLYQPTVTDDFVERSLRKACHLFPDSDDDDEEIAPPLKKPLISTHTSRDGRKSPVFSHSFHDSNHKPESVLTSKEDPSPDIFMEISDDDMSLALSETSDNSNSKQIPRPIVNDKTPAVSTPTKYDLSIFDCSHDSNKGPDNDSTPIQNRRSRAFTQSSDVEKARPKQSINVKDQPPRVFTRDQSMSPAFYDSSDDSNEESESDPVSKHQISEIAKQTSDTENNCHSKQIQPTAVSSNFTKPKHKTTLQRVLRISIPKIKDLQVPEPASGNKKNLTDSDKLQQSAARLKDKAALKQVPCSLRNSENCHAIDSSSDPFFERVLRPRKKREENSKVCESLRYDKVSTQNGRTLRSQKVKETSEQCDGKDESQKNFKRCHNLSNSGKDFALKQNLRPRKNLEDKMKEYGCTSSVEDESPKGSDGSAHLSDDDHVSSDDSMKPSFFKNVDLDSCSPEISGKQSDLCEPHSNQENSEADEHFDGDSHQDPQPSTLNPPLKTDATELTKLMSIKDSTVIHTVAIVQKKLKISPKYNHPNATADVSITDESIFPKEIKVTLSCHERVMPVLNENDVVSLKCLRICSINGTLEGWIKGTNIKCFDPNGMIQQDFKIKEISSKNQYVMADEEKKRIAEITSWLRSDKKEKALGEESESNLIPSELVINGSSNLRRNQLNNLKCEVQNLFHLSDGRTVVHVNHGSLFKERLNGGIGPQKSMQKNLKSYKDWLKFLTDTNFTDNSLYFFVDKKAVPVKFYELKVGSKLTVVEIVKELVSLRDGCQIFDCRLEITNSSSFNIKAELSQSLLPKVIVDRLVIKKSDSLEDIPHTSQTVKLNRTKYLAGNTSRTNSGKNCQELKNPFVKLNVLKENKQPNEQQSVTKNVPDTSPDVNAQSQNWRCSPPASQGPDFGLCTQVSQMTASQVDLYGKVCGSQK